MYVKWEMFVFTVKVVSQRTQQIARRVYKQVFANSLLHYIDASSCSLVAYQQNVSFK